MRNTTVVSRGHLFAGRRVRSCAGFDRNFVSATPVARLRATFAAASEDTVKITFVEPDGERVTVDAAIGDNLLDIAHDNDIDLEGACGGELACSTCHVILPQEVFDGLPEPDEEEEDMLDLALGLTDTSRLGCQVCVTAEHQNLEVILPEETADMR